MTLLIFVFLLVLLAGVPVFIALAGSSLLYTHFIAGIPDFVILHRMAGGIDSFPLLAVPFFILAGNLMNSAGITNRIYDFAVALVGWMQRRARPCQHRRLGDFRRHVGHGHGRCRGLGTIEIKAMRDHGYTTEFSVGVTAASATLGPIIPPSLPMVIFGVMANVSIGAAFCRRFRAGRSDGRFPDAVRDLVRAPSRHRARPGLPAERTGHDLRRCPARADDPRHHHRRHVVRHFHADRSRGGRLRLGAVPRPRILSAVEPARTPGLPLGRASSS